MFFNDTSYTNQKPYQMAVDPYHEDITIYLLTDTQEKGYFPWSDLKVEMITSPFAAGDAPTKRSVLPSRQRLSSPYRTWTVQPQTHWRPADQN